MFILGMTTTITGIDNLVRAAGPAANVGIARAVNCVGGTVRSGYLRHVRKVLGIRKHRHAKQGAIAAMNKRTSTRRANPGRLEYSLVGFGQGLDLLYYQAKETRRGLSVVWLGRRTIVGGGFYLGGRFPQRRGGFGPKQGMSAQRVGKARSALKFAPKGPGIPEGMVAPGPASYWESEARARLGPRIAHELTAILLGHAPGGTP